MAKKNKQTKSANVDAEVKDVEILEPDVEEKKASKKAKATKTNENNNDKSKTKAKAKNNKNKKDKKSFKQKVSEVWSELKKVSRPPFGKVVKNTCVVIAVVAICTLLLFGMDKLFSLVYNLLLS